MTNLETGKVHQYDCIEGMRLLPSESIDTVITSPPYWGLRDYGVDGQLGMEASPQAYVESMVHVFREARRVLKDEGVLWLNLGDSYNNRTKVRKSSHQPSLNGFKDERWSEVSRGGGVRMSNTSGLKEKDLVGIPWRVAFALQEDGWYLRSDVIWSKPHPMPEPVRDRPSKSHEYFFLFSKNKRYYYDKNAADHLVNTGKKTVWNVNTGKFKGAHFATFPPNLIEPCVLNSCPPDGIILDPFAGAATTGVVANANGRRFIGFELSPEFTDLANKRLADESLANQSKA